jgi:hypothetical protein
VDLIILSTSATHGQAGIFLETFATLPRARPVPILLAGDERPWWAQAATALCARPYRADELVARVRNVLSVDRRRPPGVAETGAPALEGFSSRA